MDTRGRPSSILRWIPGGVHRLFSDGPPRGKDSTCGRKPTYLLCACDRDCQSDYLWPTGKKINVSFNQTEFRKAYIWSTGRGNGAIREWSDGYQGASIEHSLKRTEIPNFKRTDRRKGNSHTCQCSSFAASTEHNSKLQERKGTSQ